MKNYSLNTGSPLPEILRFGKHSTELKSDKLQPYSWKHQAKVISYNDHLDRAGVGFWRFHCTDNQLELCPVSCKLTQLKGVQTLYSLMKRLHPLTRKDFFRNIAILALTGNGFEEEAHIILANGESRWFKLSGILEQDNHGFRSVSGTILDITAFKSEILRKTDLMAFMSHELKTPLSTVRLYVQSAVKFSKHKSKDFIEKQLIKADEQVSIMNRLIDQYLSLSTSEQISPDVQKDWFDFSGLVYEMVSHYAEINSDHVFKMELNGSLFMYGDRGQITQVMNNFISNAVKFSPKNGFIKVSCKKTNNGLLFSVMDQGSGISLEDQKYLFNKHFRASNARTGSIKGHGLGLYLSKEIIASHQGKISFESKPGLGSVFNFLIPEPKDSFDPSNDRITRFND